jgi:tetratricopeptide (TPR) repeat protein
MMRDMKKIEPPDTHHLSAACGWLELGNWQEAAADMDRISEPFREHPDVLEVRCGIYSKSGDWEGAFRSARTILDAVPRRSFGWIHTAFALHELKRTNEAMEALLPAVEQFPSEWVIRYNLACYACQLGRESEALEWFAKACEIGGSQPMVAMAQEDPDLAPLRSRILKDYPRFK